MINLAVIDLRDIIKYIIKAIVIFSILIIISKCISSIKYTKINDYSVLNNKELLSILDDNIPTLKQINKVSSNSNANDSNYDNNDNNNNNNNNINPVKAILTSQLEMINNTIEKTEEKKDSIKEEISNNAVSNEIENNEIIDKAEIGLQTEVISNNVPNKYTNTYNDVQIKNGTDYNLTDEILNPEIEINNKNIIIFHTHTCESYTPTEKYNYTQTGNFRTTDLNYTVAKVGDELSRQLISYGYNVIHDKTYHDYPAYSGSYERSLDTVKKILANNQDTDIIIDLHRDAISDYSYAPTVKIGDEYASQLMFVIGTDGGGLEHSKWQQNLKFAIKVQEKANELYPGLFKPIILRNSRYNQHLGKAACIIEVGATGNTLEQSMTSMKYLAKIISEIV